MRRFLAFGALIGLFLPFLFLFAGSQNFDTLRTVVWPSSIWLMALDGLPSVSSVASFWAMSVGANVILYALLGLFVFGIRRLVHARHITGAIAISSGGAALLAAWVVFVEHL